MRKIYLDSNILVAFFADGKNAENERKNIITRAMSNFAQLSNIRIVTSLWAITEMAKILINEKKMSNKIVAQIVNNFVKLPKLGQCEIKIIDVSPRKKYRFNNFFDDIKEKMILYNPGWGDAIHCVIMKNNNIVEILTFDSKKDFSITGLTVIDPKNVVI